LGSVGLIDNAARRRGIDAVSAGSCVSLSLDVAAAPTLRADGEATFEIEPHVERGGDVTVGTDRVHLDAHGIPNTHLDGLAHIGIDGQWHGGVPAASVFEDDRSLAAWAGAGIVTRGVLLDVPALRGTAWVSTDEAVTGDEFDACLAADGTTFERGDALLVYMGRDRFEAEGHRYPTLAEARGGRPGIGPSGAEWIADHGVSVVCWDFLDAHGPGIDVLSVHLLIWAIGLALVDNCHLGRAAEALRRRQSRAGLLMVAPLVLDRATGCMVNPLFLY
jgi:kynurenine formamidase